MGRGGIVGRECVSAASGVDVDLDWIGLKYLLLLAWGRLHSYEWDRGHGKSSGQDFETDPYPGTPTTTTRKHKSVLSPFTRCEPGPSGLTSSWCPWWRAARPRSAAGLRRLHGSRWGLLRLGRWQHRLEPGRRRSLLAVNKYHPLIRTAIFYFRTIHVPSAAGWTFCGNSFDPTEMPCTASQPKPPRSASKSWVISLSEPSQPTGGGK